MAVNTKNAYGKITISDTAIACATVHITRDCYGVIDLTTNKFISKPCLAKNNRCRGVKIVTLENRIFIELFVVLKYGVSIKSVTENLKNAVKYGIEKFTGMIVDSVNINIVGVRV